MRNGLEDLPNESDIVVVHDAARPCVRHRDIDLLFEQGMAHPDGAILAAPMRDTVKRGSASGIVESVDRTHLWRALTPQLFRRLQLTRALEAAREAGVEVTDEAMAMERQGMRPLLVEGDEDNFKITTVSDLVRFEFLLSRRSSKE